MSNRIEKFDNLDLFLNKAHWNHKKYKSFFETRSKVLIEFIEILESNNLEYSLLSIKNKNKKLVFNKREFDKFLFDEVKEINLLEEKLLQENFNVYLSEENKKIILKNHIVIEIHDNKTLNSKLKSSIYLLQNKKIKVVYINRFNFYKVKKIYKKINYLIMNIYYRVQVIGFYNSLTYSKDGIYKLKYKNFHKLDFEPLDSVNWLLRKNHLNVLTENKKHISVGSIINYLKDDDFFTKKINNINEVDTSTPFSEPIHLNRDFWESGNNFFIYPAYFEFRKNVVSYKNSNEYIRNVTFPQLYSFDYYENLDKMSDEEITEFLINNPIEITNRHITSGRHRVAAMMGRMVRNKPYINFYIKLAN